MKTMKAWRFYDFWDMRLDEVPYPQAGPGWVIIKVRVAQPSVTECLLAKGLKTYGWQEMHKLIKEKSPIQLFGHEFCGEVVEVGEGVTTLHPGDRVADRAYLPCGKCQFCLMGKEKSCRSPHVIGFSLPGCLAEYCSVPASALAKVPDDVDDNEAATIQPLTDCVQSCSDAHIEPGDIVAIIGQGEMGLLTMQSARAMGASRLIAVDIKQEALDVSSKLGADHVINAARTDPVNGILKLTGGVGADIVFEAAGAGSVTVQQAIGAVRTGGKIVIESQIAEPVTLDLLEFRNRSLRWIFHDRATAKTLQYSIDLVASRRVQVKPMINYVLHGIDKVPEAFEITLNKQKYQSISPAQVML